jgi:isopentenyl-diphosphate delta-isomerase
LYFCFRHVAKGEDYFQAAKRELEEELGIVIDLKLISSFSLSHSSSEEGIEKINVKLFLCQWDKNLNFQDEEVSEAKFFPLNEVKKMVFENPEKFNPASVVEFKYYFDYIKR